MRLSRAVVDEQTTYWHLRRSNLLDGHSDAAVKELGRLCDIRVFVRGALIYEVGDPSDSVYILESGSLALFRTAEDGREVNVSVLGPMEVFGELALAGERTRLDSARVLKDAVVCGFAREAFERFLVAHPEFALRVTKLIGQRLRRVEARIHDILFKDVRTRLAHTMARLATKFGEDVPKGRRIGMRLTQADLAQLIGSTRETTSTIFNEFRRQGLVGNDGYHIIVLDLESLATY